jgi:hypothetical protein
VYTPLIPISHSFQNLFVQLQASTFNWSWSFCWLLLVIYIKELIQLLKPGYNNTNDETPQSKENWRILKFDRYIFRGRRGGRITKLIIIWRAAGLLLSKDPSFFLSFVLFFFLSFFLSFLLLRKTLMT